MRHTDRPWFALMMEKPEGVWDISNIVAMEAFLVVKCVCAHN